MKSRLRLFKIRRPLSREEAQLESPQRQGAGVDLLLDLLDLLARAFQRQIHLHGELRFPAPSSPLE